MELCGDALVENNTENVVRRLPKSSKIGSHGFVIAEPWTF